MRVKAVESGEFKLWEDGPNFDTEMLQDVVALEGKNAYLTCRVFDRGNKTVSLSSVFLQNIIMKYPHQRAFIVGQMCRRFATRKKILHQLRN